ncbi:MAG: PepSY domain-containing protein [Acidobacteria bacterium]|nr:PepSY domain-containing protein [Acidobacteriota bacterium]
MTLNRFVYKTHKWLAAGVGLLTLLWFASGIVMVLPKNMLGGPAADPAGNSAGPDYKGIVMTIPQAITAAEAAAGGNMVTTSVDLRRIEGRLYYQISTAKSGTHLIDAQSGARLEITEEYAKQMAARLAGGRGPAQESGLVRRYGIEYPYGPLPAYRVAFDDPAATIVYVSPNTGEMLSSDRKGRIRAFIMGTHTFEFLKPLLAKRGTRIALIFSSFVGLVMTVFGSWILWIQFQNWRARRAGRAEAA